MPSWMAWAASSPAIWPARARPMSMPADTPAAVTYLPSNTTRSLTGTAPCCPSSPRASQCEVARRPFGGPEPVVQGAVVHLVVLAGAAGDDQDIRAGDVGERGLGRQVQAPLVVADPARLLGGEDHLRAGQAAEHLVRADRVQGGEPVVEHDHDLHDSPFQGGAGRGRKRRRYSAGLTPSARTKARRMASGVP